jgi:sulfite reductase (NADPH) hemoprotein beta-component
VIGFCAPEQVLDVAEAVILTQRDFGNRKNRKQSRLKYTIDSRGLDWFKGEVEGRLGYSLAQARAFRFDTTGDRFGWTKGEDGRYHYTLFVMSGRILDNDEQKLLSGLREIAKFHDGQFRVTCNQNIMIAGVSAENKARVDAVLAKHGLEKNNRATGLRLNAIACVAFPTCSQAMAESERYLPTLLTKLEAQLQALGLEKDEIVIRMTGCPNGCGRPYNAEIGLVGKAVGRYNLYLGASHVGDRLNKLYRENIGEDAILTELQPLFARYASERKEREHFGDFLVRVGVIEATQSGKQFHE